MTLLKIIIILAIMFALYKVIKNYKKNTEESQSTQDDTLNHQENKAPIELSEEDKLEMSWGFLYRITDIIKRRFSKDEQKQLYEIGKKLIEYNMQYNHSVKNWYSAYYNTNNKKNKLKDNKKNKLKDNTKDNTNI